MKGRSNPAAGILDLGLSQQEKIDTMLEAAAIISDHLIEVKEYDLNSAVCVASLELLIFALHEFADFAEQDKLAMDSRRAVLLDGAWSIFNLFYVKFLQHVTHHTTSDAAHILHALLEDYVIEAHQIMFDVNKHNFNEQRLFDKHFELSDTESSRYLDVLATKLNELHQAYFTQYPDKVASLKDICKAEKSALNVARILLGFYIEHHEYDVINRDGHRIAQIENIYQLFKNLYEQRFKDSSHQAQAHSFLKILEKYLHEATAELELIMLSHRHEQTNSTQEDDELSSSFEEHPYIELSDEAEEPVVKLIHDDGAASDEEYIAFDPNTAIWTEVSPLRESANNESTHLLSDVSDDESSAPASPLPTRATLARNAALMFQPQARHPVTIPITIPDPDADDLYSSNGPFTL